ncbi:carbon-nitrogen hydrolase family protein [Bdellovibrio svalbardensis]|uniref:Carbon-nitrogen hydrolase family protein n=1 Tax=Bdellovibrio svalbardensis TaxID=2972972 RepID=A0ABT6DH27_9BACT|nr:carbon-nitrogen hydrolase family protein [Bdellovibrio svalbardensis]MDG0816103.1 carbon-nitrogen hydrolase family protein [Bdellovibrio svalbardensis]
MSFRIATAQYPIQKHTDLAGWKDYVESWVQEATSNHAKLLVFPEFGSMELFSVMPEKVQKSLSAQIKEMTKLHDEFVETYQVLAQKYECFLLAPSIVVLNEEKETVNRAYFFGPSGGVSFQEKNHTSRLENEKWGVVTGDASLQVFETGLGDIGVSMSDDVQFPTSANKLAKEGIKILLAPSYTKDLQGAHRVHIGARARALENQFYVIVSQTVGEALWSLAVDRNNGFAAVYGPADQGFPEDGIVAKGEVNEPGWLYAELDLDKVDHVRSKGDTLNFKQS